MFEMKFEMKLVINMFTSVTPVTSEQWTLNYNLVIKRTYSLGFKRKNILFLVFRL